LPRSFLEEKRGIALLFCEEKPTTARTSQAIALILLTQNNRTSEVEVSETVESKQQRLDKLKAQQRALLDRAKAVELRIRRAESADKSKRRKQDDRTKLLVGVALLEAAQKNAHLRTMLRDAVRVLKPADRTFLTEQSALWAEFEALGQEAKPQAAAPTVKTDTQP
jgi:hypothetical protein